MKSPRILLVAALASALVLSAFATGCAKKELVAKVNGEGIEMAALDSQIAQLNTSYPNMFSGADGEGRLIDMKQRLLETLINQKLVEQAAKAKGIRVSDKDVEKQIQTLQSRFSDKSQFENALKSSGMTIESLTNQLKGQLINTKLTETLGVASEVTSAEVKAYYDKNLNQFRQKEQRKASHVLMKSSDKAAAQKVLNRLRSGKLTIAEAAKQYSIDKETATNGGDLGWSDGSGYVPEFQAVYNKLGKGELSNLVKSSYGYHIIEVTDVRKAKIQPLSEVTQQITQILQSQRKAEAYQKFLDELKKTAKIEILVQELKGAADAVSSSIAPTSTK